MVFRSLDLFTAASEDSAEVGAVGGLSKGFERPLKGGLVEESHLEAYLLQTGNAKALTVLNGTDEVSGLKQGLVGSGIEPCRATAELLNLQTPFLEIDTVQIGDLELSAGGGF